MIFAPFTAQITALFKFADMTNVESCIFINNCFDKDSSSAFTENFKLVSTAHSYNTK